jgi:hypothetical protein
LLSSALCSPHSRYPAHTAVSSACCCVFLQESEFPPRGRPGPACPGRGFGSVCRSGLLIFLYSLLTLAALAAPLPGGAAGAARRSGAKKVRDAKSFRSAACADSPRTRVRAQRVHALRNVVADGVPNKSCRPCSIPRRLWRSAAHANGAVRNGSTNVRLASRDTRGGLRACCSRAARRRGERPVFADSSVCRKLVVRSSDSASRRGCEQMRLGGRRSLVRVSACAPRQFIRLAEFPRFPFWNLFLLVQNQ